MNGVTGTATVQEYYEAWYSFNTRNVLEVIRFEINGTTFELEKSLLNNRRSIMSAIGFLAEKKKESIERGEIIKIPGNKKEERQWKIYFDYLKGESTYDIELTSRKAVERMVILMYFGVAIPDILVYLGVTRETLSEIMGKFLSVMDRRMTDCLKKIDGEKKLVEYIKRGALHISYYDLNVYNSNEDNIKDICQYYGINEQVEEMVKRKKQENEEKIHELNKNETMSKIYGSLRVRKENIQPKIDIQKINKMRELLAKKNIKISKIQIDPIEDIKALKICQKRISTVVVMEKYQIKKLRDRKKDFIEFVDTERNLVNNMKKLNELYRKPMIEAAKNGQINEKDIKRIFTTLEKCIINSDKFEKALRPLVNSFKYDTCIGNEIFKNAILVTPYLPFTTDYNIADKVWKNIRELPIIQEIISKANKVQGDSPADFPTLLIQPVQRTMRYPLLLETIKKHTPPLHPDYEQIINAEQIFKFFSMTINQRAKMRDGLMDLADLFNNDDLIKDGRYLVNQSEIEISREKYMAFLMNDQIAYVKEKIYSQAKIIKTKSKVKPSIISINKDMSIDHSSYCIYFKEDIFRFENKQICSQWVDEIQGIIEDKFYDLLNDEAWYSQYLKK
ncbi:Rho/RAC guanine nucleotide exchange factor, putative [Entamoeba dispar SAW760]|uniref:Rho/RAC guanine nucleotide exchange factor, putative n=1 Tax=Entamoeba dispar (strain ATCC PRA-260 / SAW760) TaxID=370354 RepID=B0EMC2_ENTDS|nr:Rho/RAC guanine nucleotide exchange factor, putative [Entamoeba dispar SAW760]EDR24340.1 Rho/RAC guanine nucleotide exchange factor, putative [Entamoeba dispar SAW760]|eukprot:EDR24340.1 Rho/RAC guanine nucleotide exchange factor, putative [Entamoeba dispar SAW760]